MIKVYLEDGICAHLLAVFDNEQTYIEALPILEKIAKRKNMILTESVCENVLKF